MKIFTALQTQYKQLDQSIRAYVADALGSAAASYTSSNVFGMILNVIRGLWQNAMLFLEDAVTEQNIQTATRVSSIQSLARLSGYDPFYGYAAQGVLDVALLPNNSSSGDKIVIPDRVRVRHVDSGKTYIVNLPYSYYSVSIGGGAKPFQLPIVQGSFYTSSFATSGVALESFSIKTDAFYDINFVTVKVNGVKWERYESLYDMHGAVDGYVITQGFDGEFQIILGNGSYGRIPESGSSVVCEYLIHRGEYGNLPETESAAFVFLDSLRDSKGDTIDGNELFILRKSGAIAGGVDAESVKSVRLMTGYNSRAKVLANADNYKLFLRRFSFVGHNAVWTDANSMEVNMNVLTNVAQNCASGTDYFSLKEEDFVLSDDHKTLIKQTVENSKQSFAGTTVRFVDPVIRNFAALVYVKKDPRFDDEALRADIVEAVGEYFANLPDDALFIPKSDIVNKISGLRGVRSVDVAFVSKANEAAALTKEYETWERAWQDGVYKIRKTTRVWDKSQTLCLDPWLNISLETQLEYPVLLGGFEYFPDKNDMSQRVTLDDAVNIFFI